MNEPKNADLLNGLVVNINYPECNFETELKGFNSIKSFFEKEKFFWSDLKFNSSPIKDFKNHFSTCISRLDQFYNNTKDADQNHFNNNWTQIRSYLASNSPSNNPILHSTTSEAQFIHSFFSRNENTRGQAAYKFIVNQYNTPNKRADFIGYALAYEFMLPEFSDLAKRRNSEKISLGRMRGIWSEKTSGIHSYYDDFTESMSSWRENFTDEITTWKDTKDISINEWRDLTQDQFDQLLSASRKRIQELEELYVEKLRLEGPVKHWVDRAEKYKNAGFIWAVLLAVTVLVSTILIANIFMNPPAYLNESIFGDEGPLAVKGILLFGTLISFLVYFMRTCSKMTFSSYHLMRDAQEREQLTMVYLALLEKGAVAEKERELILQAVFSRAETGLISDESGPTMPGFAGLFDKAGR